MNADRYVGDVGVPIEVIVKKADGTLRTDLESATTRLFMLEKPSGAHVTWTPTLNLPDASDGKLTYDTQEGDLDEAGVYMLQVFLDYGSVMIKTSQAHFVVGDVLA